MEKNRMVILATGIMKDSEGRILLLKRSANNSSFIKDWQLPEGKVEFGEDPIDALEREIKEETNCILTSNLRLFDVKSAIASVNGMSIQIIRIGYEVTGWKGKIEISEDHDEFKWLNINDALKINLVVGVKDIINSYKEIKKK